MRDYQSNYMILKGKGLNYHYREDPRLLIVKTQ